MKSIRVPRFQFFYGLRDILTALISFPSEQKRINKDMLASAEIKLAKLFSRPHAILTSSYRVGLLDSLLALNLPIGSEVILGPITIADTINSIRMAGLVPVFCDLDLDTQSPCLDGVSRRINPKTKVILVTYLSGIVPQIDDLVKLCKSNDLVLIEDFSQAMGATYRDRPIGFHGDISIASLSIGKNLSTLAGGLILFNDDNLLIPLQKKQSDRGQYPNYVLWYLLKACIKVEIATCKFVFSKFTFHILRMIAYVQKSFPPHFNHDTPIAENIFRSSLAVEKKHYPPHFFSKLSYWQVQILLRQLSHYASDLNLRKNNALLFLSQLNPSALIRFPSALNSPTNSFYHLPFYGNGDSDKFRAYLFKHGIDSGGYGLNLCSEEVRLGLRCEELKNARVVKYDCTFIPINEHSTREEILYIADLINSYCANH